MALTPWLLTLAKIAAIFAIGFPLLMYLVQDRLIFFPRPLEDAQRSALLHGRVQSMFIHAADGTRLHAWHVKDESARTLLIYFGGNAEEVSWMLHEAGSRTPGMSWLLVDYRGYGSSQGAPSEAALVADALQWYDEVAAHYPSVYLLGRSLGSGVAVQLAAARPVAGVILVTPFDSMVEVGRRHYPFLPVGWMLRHRFDSIAAAPKISAPLLCLVAARDEIIPAAHARRLFDAWGGPRRWVALDGAGHNSTDEHRNYWPSILAFLK